MTPAERAPETMTLSLARLLEHPAFGLSCLAAPDLERRVRGAHSIEIEGAGRWLPPGYAVLTTGLRFGPHGPDAEQARALVADLCAARSAALLFGVGITVATVPDTLVQACARSGLPCLSVPVEVPFWQIEDFVQRSLRTADAYRLQRRLWLQDDLLEALGHERPVLSVVARLAALVSGTAVLYEESGRIAAATGVGPARLIWTELRARGLAGGRFRVGRWHVATRTMSVRGVAYVVALASRREDLLDDLADTLLETAHRLLAAVGGAKALGTAQAGADAAQLLATLQAGITPEEALRVWERLRGYRFVMNGELRCFAAVPLPSAEQTGQAGAPGSPGPSRPSGSSRSSAFIAGSSGIGGDASEQRWLELHEEAAALGLPLLMRAEPETGADMPAGALWGLLGGSPALSEWVEVLARTHHVGLSPVYRTLPATRARLQEAIRAAWVASGRAGAAIGSPGSGEPPGGSGTARSATQGRIVSFEDLDLATWLLSGQERVPLADKAARQVAALMPSAALRDTALAYLANDLDVAATAAALFLHPNSVRYRLRRIEELLGGPVNSPAIIANLYLALHDELPAAAPPQTGHPPGYSSG